MSFKRKFIELKSVERRSGRYMVITLFKPEPIDMFKVYDMAKKLWEKYKIITTIRVERAKCEDYYDEPQEFIVISQYRGVSTVDKDVPKIVFYVNPKDGRIFVTKTNYRKIPSKLLNGATQMLLYGLGYKVERKKVRIDKT